MTFQYPVLLLALPLLLVAYWFLRAPTTVDDWSKSVHPRLLHWYTSGERNHHKRITVLLLSCISVLALASPSTPDADNSDKNEQAFAHAQGWLLLIDVSKSTTLTDVVPNRLNAMRETAKRISQQAGAIPVGLIIYAGDAFLVAPPAIDKHFLDEKLALLEFGLVSAEGSNPTRAVALASSVLQSAGFVTARTFMLTDGGGLNSKITPAIANHAATGHRLDFLIFGNETHTGEVSNSEEQLQKLADAAKGKVVESDVLGNLDLNQLELSTRVRSSALIDRGGFSMLQQTNQSHWLLLLALPLCLYLFIRERG